MTQLNDNTVAWYAKQAGFSGNDLAVAVAVAHAESHLRLEETHVNDDGSTDYGLWQINSVHSQLLAGKNWQDPAVNAAMAYDVWTHEGWRAWSVYKNGAYLQYLAIAQIAASNPTPDNADRSKPGNAQIVPSNDSILGLVKGMTDPATWRRFGLFAGGTVLLVIGVRPLVKGMT